MASLSHGSSWEGGSALSRAPVARFESSKIGKLCLSSKSPRENLPSEIQSYLPTLKAVCSAV